MLRRLSSKCEDFQAKEVLDLTSRVAADQSAVQIYALQQDVPVLKQACKFSLARVHRLAETHARDRKKTFR